VTAREIASAPLVRAAVAGLLIAATVAVVALVGAMRSDREPPRDPKLAAPAFVLTAPLAVAPTDIRETVAHDVFAADRQAPGVRYRAPGDDDVAAKQQVGAPSRPVVLGTAVSDAAPAFAVAQVGSDRPSIVHVGEKVGTYTVLTIDRSHVVFVAPSGEKFDIQPSTPEPAALQPSNDANVQTPAYPGRRRGGRP